MRSLLQNVVDFHLEATRKDRGYVEKDFSFTDGAVIATSTPASSLCSGCSIPQLWKGDFAVLASQLQVTRTKLGKEGVWEWGMGKEGRGGERGFQFFHNG